MWKWAGFKGGWIDGKDHETDDEQQRWNYHMWQFILNFLSAGALSVCCPVLLALVALALLDLFAG